MASSPATRVQTPGTQSRTNCCCGLNTILNLPVPPGDKSDGAAVNVSGLQGVKTIELSGTYVGSYWIYGSHDGNLFFPVANFDSGGGSQTVRKTLEVAANFMKVHREAPQSGLVTVNIAARATVPCSTSQGGSNNFFNLATLQPGTTGPQAPLDLFTLVAATGLDVSNVACSGAFTGQIAIESSLDGTNFSPVGSFYSTQAQRGSGTGQLMFDPLVVNQIIRYLRVNILPSTVITGPTSFTVGGPQNCACIPGCTLNLHPNIAGTQGLWQFQGNLLDSSANGYNLFQNDTGPVFGPLGCIQGAILEQNTGFQTSLIANVPNLAIAGDLTIEFLIVPSNGTPYEGNFCECLGSGAHPDAYEWSYILPHNGFNGHVYFSSPGGSGGQMAPPDLYQAPLTAVHHLTLRRTAGPGGIGGIVEIFDDGILQAGTRAFNNPIIDAGNYHFVVGGYNFGVPYTPPMATLRVLNYARSNANILADSNWCLLGIGPPPP